MKLNVPAIVAAIMLANEQKAGTNIFVPNTLPDQQIWRLKRRRRARNDRLRGGRIIRAA